MKICILLIYRSLVHDGDHDFTLTFKGGDGWWSRVVAETCPWPEVTHLWRIVRWGVDRGGLFHLECWVSPLCYHDDSSLKLFLRDVYLSIRAIDYFLKYWEVASI